MYDDLPAAPRAAALAEPTRCDQPATLGAALNAFARQAPERIALVASTAPPVTYGALAEQISATHRQLRRAGLGAEARVGLLLREPAQAALAIVAVACAAVAVPLDPRLTETELEPLFERLRLDGLIALPEDLTRLRRLAERTGMTLVEARLEHEGPLRLILEGPPDAACAADADIDPDAPAFILRSSGTTALPKLIPYTHRNLLAAARRWQHWFGLGPDDRCLCISAPYYSHGLKVTVLTPLLTGGSLAFPIGPAVVDLAEWFDALQPTWYSAGPALHRAIVEAATQRPDAWASRRLRFASSGGAPLADEIHQGYQASLGFPLLEHYGSSEAAQIAANTPGAQRAGTVGRPWPGTLRVVDEDGQPLPAGEPGEVQVRGPTVMPGYLGDDALNARSHLDGWFRTGDRGRLDEHGFLTLLGRLQEVVNRGGEKISLQEIDLALLRHPAVLEAAAFAVPHPRLGQDIAAAAVLRPGANVDAATLRQFLREHLVSFKVPRRIVLLERLPTGLTGKVQRQRLTEAHGERAAETPSDGPATPLEAELLALWQRLLKVDTLGVHDDFFEAGGDSLLATDMLGEIEQRLGRVVPDALLAEADTVRALAARLEDDAQRCVPVIDFNPSGSRPPLFWFHGDFAQGGYYVRRLAKLLGAQQPFTAIEPHGLGNEPIPESIEAMARARLALIRERQATGPYHIGGYCNGALVALETARLLREAGERVELLALVDPPTANMRAHSRLLLAVLDRLLPGPLLARIYEALTRFGESSKQTYPSRFADLLLRLGGNLRQRLRGEPGTGAASASARERQIHARFLHYSQVMARYRPQPLDVPVMFFSADYDSRPWRRLGAQFETVEVPGGHHRCIKDHTLAIAQPLRAWLEQSDAPGSAGRGDEETVDVTLPLGAGASLGLAD